MSLVIIRLVLSLKRLRIFSPLHYVKTTPQNHGDKRRRASDDWSTMPRRCAGTIVASSTIMVRLGERCSCCVVEVVHQVEHERCRLDSDRVHGDRCACHLADCVDEVLPFAETPLERAGQVGNLGGERVDTVTKPADPLLTS